MGLFVLGSGSAFAAWERVQDFEELAPGPVSKAPGWITRSEASVFDIVSDPSGRHLRSGRSSGDWRYWWAALPLPSPLPTSGTATLFLRFRWRPDAANELDFSIGLTRAAPAEHADYGLYGVQLAGTRTPDGLMLRVRDGADLTEVLLGLPPETWVQCWLVVDVGARTFRVFLAPGTGDAAEAHQLGQVFRFREGWPEGAAITHFAAMRSTKQGEATFEVDDLWVDRTGINLRSPLANAPAIRAR